MELQGSCGCDAAMSSTPVRTEENSNTWCGLDFVSPTVALNNSIKETRRAWTMRGLSVFVQDVSSMSNSPRPRSSPPPPCAREKNMTKTRNHMMFIAALPINRMSCFAVDEDEGDGDISLDPFLDFNHGSSGYFFFK